MDVTFLVDPRIAAHPVVIAAEKGIVVVDARHPRFKHFVEIIKRIILVRTVDGSVLAPFVGHRLELIQSFARIGVAGVVVENGIRLSMQRPGIVEFGVDVVFERPARLVGLFAHEPAHLLRRLHHRLLAALDPPAFVIFVDHSGAHRLGQFAHVFEVHKRRIARHAHDIAPPGRVGREIAHSARARISVVGVCPAAPPLRHGFDRRSLNTDGDIPRLSDADGVEQIEADGHGAVGAAKKLHRIALRRMLPAAIDVRSI